MNKDMRLWKNIQTVGLVVDDSLSVRARSWLQIVSGDLCNVSEPSNLLEMAWKVELGFDFFAWIFEFGSAVFEMSRSCLRSARLVCECLNENQVI